MHQTTTYPQLNNAVFGATGNVIDGNFTSKDILSLDQFTVEDLHRLFRLADEMKQLVLHHEPSSLLAGYVVSLLFFEPSSRTFGSFASAVKRLGGQTLEIQNPEMVSSVNKGESFEDTMRTFEAYSDAIVLRHYRAGAARLAADTASVPLINAGDGNNEHPTQTLLDLYTIYKHLGRLDNLTCLLAGDPLNSRVIHSMLRGLSLFENNKVYVLSPEQLRFKRAEIAYYRECGLKIVEIDSERDIPACCDLWYWTRIQKERFASQQEYDMVLKQGFLVTPELLRTRAGKDTIIMDPLPRVSTIDPAVDADERAVYFRAQIRNGLYIRMALLALVLGRA
ncbi:MAG TPA: aspartate carbamoyltransferase [Ktedonobacteraceae bacterium]|nr:aspartate carbamoyltransferase [Ktedonobacteraceae bacterium]